MPSLSLCALGAGAAHAAMLALVLPVMITLPAPKDRAQGTIAVQVAVRAMPPSTFIAASMSDRGSLPVSAMTGEGDADDASWTVPADVEVTGALQSLPEQAAVAEETPLIEEAALAEPRIAAPPGEAVTSVGRPDAALPEGAPAPALEEDVELDTVASIEVAPSDEPDFMPDVVPRPSRKPKPFIVEERKAEPAPAPRRRVVAPVRTRTVTRPFKGLLGGTQAVPMKEFPFRTGR